ncbi:MAG: DUF192 domain-containing protein [Patescibacteria group bacterium]|jgi:uncharacterized membrane protein (UPF0127 family)
MSRSIVNLFLILILFGGFFTAFFYEDLAREARFLWTDIRELFQPLEEWEVVLEDGTELSLPVAQTEDELQRGLMNRRSLEDGEGMILAYDEPSLHSIWMKNVYFNLDLLWVENDTVMYLLPNTQRAAGVENPPIYSPDAPSTYVVEFPAGYAKTHAIEQGGILMIKKD